MDRIVVEVYIPAINRSFDFNVPAQCKAGEVTAELIRIMQTTQRHIGFDTENAMLCDRERGRAIPPDAFLSDAGIQDSCRLMLL